MAEDSSAQLISIAVERDLQLETLKLNREFFYRDFLSCVIDAIFSIGVAYESVEKAVHNYWAYQLGLQTCQVEDPRLLNHIYGTAEYRLQPTEPDTSISDFLLLAKQLSVEELARDVFKNRQRTSTQNGILKSEAVAGICHVLNELNILSFESLRQVLGDQDRFQKLQDNFCGVRGQKSGISFNYFLMLAGSDEHIKPDRMVIRYLSGVLGKQIDSGDASPLLIDASVILKKRWPRITPRLLDYGVWSYQRTQGSA